jgi:hypothetical protein
VSAGRKRVRLVPAKDAVECFEIRLALYLTLDGESRVGYEISDPESTKVWPPLHEVLGVLDFGARLIVAKYDEEDDE